MPNCTSLSDAWGMAYALDVPVDSTDKTALDLAPCMALYMVDFAPANPDVALKEIDTHSLFHIMKMSH